jgi:release factor glutamine methyltransferase
MIIRIWLDTAYALLYGAGIPTPRLDAELLLADALQTDRSWLHAHPEHEIPPAIIKRLNRLISRRLTHEPIAYIRGKQEFFGREFAVSPATLTPRPETEQLIDDALHLLQQDSSLVRIADIGTGSGCIIITLALEAALRSRTFIGIDISKDALLVAAKNKQHYQVDIELHHEDMTDSALPDGWHDASLVVANLPYVPRHFSINLAATHEPAQSIYGGEDGLDYYRVLFQKTTGQNRYLITESLPPQHQALAEIAYKNSYALTKTADLIQVFTRR